MNTIRPTNLGRIFKWVVRMNTETLQQTGPTRMTDWALIDFYCKPSFVKDGAITRNPLKALWFDNLGDVNIYIASLTGKFKPEYVEVTNAIYPPKTWQGGVGL